MNGLADAGAPNKRSRTSIALALVEKAARENRLRVIDIIEPGRKRFPTEIRRMIMRELHSQHGFSKTQLGRLFEVDHSTVIYHLRYETRDAG